MGEIDKSEYSELVEGGFAEFEKPVGVCEGFTSSQPRTLLMDTSRPNFISVSKSAA